MLFGNFVVMVQALMNCANVASLMAELVKFGFDVNLDNIGSRSIEYVVIARAILYPDSHDGNVVGVKLDFNADANQVWFWGGDASIFPEEQRRICFGAENALETLKLVLDTAAAGEVLL